VATNPALSAEVVVHRGKSRRLRPTSLAGSGPVKAIETR
jgi:hypothetical protein